MTMNVEPVEASKLNETELNLNSATKLNLAESYYYCSTVNLFIITEGYEAASVCLLFRFIFICIVV